MAGARLDRSHSIFFRRGRLAGRAAGQTLAAHEEKRGAETRAFRWRALPTPTLAAAHEFGIHDGDRPIDVTTISVRATRRSTPPKAPAAEQRVALQGRGNTGPPDDGRVIIVRRLPLRPRKKKWGGLCTCPCRLNAGSQQFPARFRSLVELIPYWAARIRGGPDGLLDPEQYPSIVGARLAGAAGTQYSLLHLGPIQKPLLVGKAVGRGPHPTA